MSTKHTFIDKLNSVYDRFTELRDKISDPEIVKKPEYKEYLREYGGLEDLMSVFEKYKKLENEINDDRQLLEDEQTEEELKEIAREEITGKEQELEVLLKDALRSRWEKKISPQTYQNTLDDVISRKITPWKAVQILLKGAGV